VPTRSSNRQISIAEYKDQQRQRWTERELQHVEIFNLIHTLSRLISTRFDRAMAQHGITHSQWWALVNIYEKDGLSQTELATVMQMGRASTGWLLEQLEKKGWIERKPDPKDSRVRRVYLGDAAVPIFQMMDIEVPRMFQTFMADLAAPKEVELLKTLRTLRKGADR
jgi:DNA-binding MarR family transcriptional regulator